MNKLNVLMKLLIVAEESTKYGWKLEALEKTLEKFRTELE